MMHLMELLCHKLDKINIFLIVILYMVTNNIYKMEEPLLYYVMHMYYFYKVNIMIITNVTRQHNDRNNIFQ